MGLGEQLRADMKEAMKAGDKVRLSTVRMLISELHNAQLAAMDTVDEAGELEMLVRQAKRRRESIEAYGKAGRDDLVAGEAAELAVIETYLPQPLSADEAKAMVDEAVAETGATSMKDMGRVMSAVMPKLKGRFPGKDVKPLVEAALRG
ncbi:MAG: GatB/YqeY domain-containing protein [Deltaproteobacteria bacterium]|nr:GatB/YqeY domain-containing protein [Deltaproteobacteria bacterium]